MDAERQKGQQHHGDEGADGTRFPEHGRQQAFTAFDQTRALTVSLMEQVCDPKNLLRAYRRVRSNKGKPGVDGMTVRELADWLRENNEALTASLLDGTCRPQPVRGVSIPKPGGVDPVRRRRDQLILDKADHAFAPVVNQLGIPVVVDRLVQQMILQVLDPIFDPTFSNSSYGFRPGRSPQGSPLVSGGFGTGTEIRCSGRARVCREPRPRKVFRPGKPRYPHVPNRAQDRR